MRLTAKTYFRLSLAVPVALPLLFALFGTNLLSGVLVMSLFFGGIPYVFFAVCLFFIIARFQSVGAVRRLSYLAPVLFIPFQAAFWLVPLAMEARSGLSLTGGLNSLVPFAAYILILGYLYVLLVNMVFRCLRSRGLIVETH